MVKQKAHRTYRHEALFWRDAEEFLAGTVPFVEAAVDAGEPVMVAVIEERSTLLRDALGTASTDVHFVDMAELGRNPARIIPAWRSFVDEHTATDRPVRGIGEPIWPGRRPAEISESQLHEALLNVAIEPDTPLWLMCPYDVGRLDEAVVEEAYRSHPVIVDAGEYRGSTSYGGLAQVEVAFGGALPDLGQPIEQLPYREDNLPGVVSSVATTVYQAGMRADEAADFAVVIRELIRSSLWRGADEGLLCTWVTADSVICELQDRTRVSDPLLGRRAPTGDTRNGIWLANQRCDLVQLRSTEAGTRVRVHHWF